MAEENQTAVQIEEIQEHQEEGEDAEAELEAMKQRVKEMEEEAAKLREMQAQVEKEMNLTTEVMTFPPIYFRSYAYVEFADPSLVAHAMLLDNTVLRGRPIKVTAKRTNIPGFARGRGVRGRASWRGAFYGHGAYFGPTFRGGRPR
ncbi:3815_t:CDS:2 [Acaulospora colombiana]|uniref:3815_t:CDS:1 n=2 Tax=Acaulospora colombiana TaxID=27376 RepID=A0ACA9JYL5_9GLOM|nr:11413_t:CDS:2 [Acaulospora colombiana]CAG8442377.1 3815_t:CDS:2 [Acaulospora colombiana]